MAHIEYKKCCDSDTFWLYIIIIVGLLLFSGLMSGLTLGLMSFSQVDLEVIMKSGEGDDRKHAAKIIPVVRKQHLLLVTLLVGNAMAMEALPLFLDSLVGTVIAIVLSVTLLLMFGEILPQAVCTRYGLAVGATMAPFVRVLLVVMFPIAWPVSKFLDWLLGSIAHKGLYGRSELITFVDLHGHEAGIGGQLSRHETMIIARTIELAEKTARDAMTFLGSVVSIDVQSEIEEKMMITILASGHSKIPVYFRKPCNIIGFILVKNFWSVIIDQRSKHSTVDVAIKKIPRVSEGMPLHDVLHEFRKTGSDIAVVVRSTNASQEEVLDKRVAIDVPPDTTHTEPIIGSVTFRGSNVDTKSTTDDKSSNNGSSEEGMGLAANKFHRIDSQTAQEGDIIGIITRDDVVQKLLTDKSLTEEVSKPAKATSLRESLSHSSSFSKPRSVFFPPKLGSQLPRYPSMDDGRFSSIVPLPNTTAASSAPASTAARFSISSSASPTPTATQPTRFSHSSV